MKSSYFSDRIDAISSGWPSIVPDEVVFEGEGKAPWVLGGAGVVGVAGGQMAWQLMGIVWSTVGGAGGPGSRDEKSPAFQLMSSCQHSWTRRYELKNVDNLNKRQV
jgi:hypothetical protein